MIKAMPNRAIVKIHKNVHDERKTDSGIVLPGDEKNIKELTHWVATVVDVDKAQSEVKVGDVVVFGKYAGSSLVDDYVSVFISDILGIC